MGKAFNFSEWTGYPAEDTISLWRTCNLSWPCSCKRKRRVARRQINRNRGNISSPLNLSSWSVPRTRWQPFANHSCQGETSKGRRLRLGNLCGGERTG
jgi:hypothetical protein